MKSIIAIFFACSVFSAYAADTQVATFAQVEGRTQIFTKPSKKPYPEKSVKDGTMAFFEGEYFLIRNANLGDRIENGNIVRTLPGGQAKIIYDNGDQFYVGSGTAYRIVWDDPSNQKLDAKIQLMYGRMRGVIAKDGPRKKLQIRTRAATMGVRGTDFFIADTGPKGETEISVVRGSVEVQANDGKKEVQEIKTGMSAAVTGKIETRETTKEDLSGIKQASILPAPQVKPDTDKSLVEKIEQLEKKAVEITLKDIKTYQPEVYEKIAKDPTKPTLAQDLNTKTVEVAAVNAPSAPPKRRKPRITELKDTDDANVYDQYFKVGN